MFFDTPLDGIGVLSPEHLSYVQKLTPFGFAETDSQRGECKWHEVQLCASTFLGVKDIMDSIPTVGRVFIHELAHNVIDTDDCTFDNFCSKKVGAPSWYCQCDGAIINYNKSKCLDYSCEASIVDSTCWEAFITEFDSVGIL